MALMDGEGIQLSAGDDASDARWFRIKYTLLEESKTVSPSGSTCTQLWQLELTEGDTVLFAKVRQTSGQQGDEITLTENDGLAFDHAKIIAYAIHRLRNKVEYTDLALNLMPERFTLTELQQVYEVILGEPLYKAAFRRKIKDLVRETGEYIENAGHRPSQLFRRYWEESR